MTDCQRVSEGQSEAPRQDCQGECQDTAGAPVSAADTHTDAILTLAREFAAFRAETGGQLAALRLEVADLRAALKPPAALPAPSWGATAALEAAATGHCRDVSPPRPEPSPPRWRWWPRLAAAFAGARAAGGG